MLYYTLRNGKLVDELDLHRAYEIVTGNIYDCIHDHPAYLSWLYSLCGKSVVSVKKDSDMTIEDFLEANAIIKAVREYRDRNGCTLREAKDAIDRMRYGDVAELWQNKQRDGQ